MVATAHVDNTMTHGRLAREAAGGFHELLDGSAITSTEDTGWLDKGFVHNCTAHIEVATVTGAGSAVVQIEQADDDSGTNAEVLLITPSCVEANDNTAIQAEICVDRRYVKVTTTVTGTFSITPTVTLRNAKDHRNFGDYGLAWS